MFDFMELFYFDLDFQKWFVLEFLVDEWVELVIKACVEEVFGEVFGLDIDIEVWEGKFYEKLLYWIKIKEVDLLIMGKKCLSEGSGIMVKCVVCNVYVVVLLVFDGVGVEIVNFVVFNDFFENVVCVLYVVLAFSCVMKGQFVYSLYIVDLLLGYYYNCFLFDCGYLGMFMELVWLVAGKFWDVQGIVDDNIVDVFQENNWNNLVVYIICYVVD